MPVLHTYRLRRSRSRSFRSLHREWLRTGRLRSERSLSPHTTLPVSEGSSGSGILRWTDSLCRGLRRRCCIHSHCRCRLHRGRTAAILRWSQSELRRRRSLRTPTTPALAHDVAVFAPVQHIRALGQEDVTERCVAAVAWTGQHHEVAVDFSREENGISVEWKEWISTRTKVSKSFVFAIPMAAP